MATSSFYDVACRAAKAPEVHALMTELRRLARKGERLQEEFAAQILANRTRREGKPPKISKAARRWQRQAEEGGREADERLAQLVPQLSDEQLLRQALNGWDMATHLHNPADYHEDDRAFAERIDRHYRQALRRVKNFYRGRGLPIPNLSSGGGIGFAAAFRR